MVVSSGMPTEQYPLQGIFEFDQAKALSQAGCEVVFLAIDLRSARRWRKWGVSKGNKDGVDYYVINIPIGRFPLKYFCRIGEMCLYRLYKLVVKTHWKPDVIHAHFTEMGCITSDFAKKIEVPYVVTEHSSKINQYRISGELKDCALKAYKGASVVIAVGNSLAHNIQRHTGISPKVVPNIIDTELFFRCKRQKHEGFHLVTTSNLIVLKRTWQILQALARIDTKDIDYRLTIIGDGPEMESLQHWAKTLNMENRITLAGYQSRENIASIYETADVFIMVSSSETFGVAYVEAMAAGLPVIATRCGGPEDFVNNNNGLMVDVDDIHQIAEAIKTIYYNINKYDAEQLRTFVRSRFSAEAVGKELISIYHGLV